MATRFGDEDWTCLHHADGQNSDANEDDQIRPPELEAVRRTSPSPRLLRHRHRHILGQADGGL